MCNSNIQQSFLRAEGVLFAPNMYLVHRTRVHRSQIYTEKNGLYNHDRDGGVVFFIFVYSSAINNIAYRCCGTPSLEDSRPVALRLAPVYDIVIMRFI